MLTLYEIDFHKKCESRVGKSKVLKIIFLSTHVYETFKSFVNVSRFIGSGNIAHNLRLSMERLRTGDTRPYDWAVEFDNWAKEKIASRDFQTLVTYEKAGEVGKLAVPTTDHYIPMLYSLGLAGEKEEIKQTYEEVTLGGISMRTFQVGV
ncbi:MAG: hypothetical protein KIS77_17475 [Saprospiraceae bacterium]|nr:hypothetical protein [Saprospiraceae bacterium]